MSAVLTCWALTGSLRFDKIAELQLLVRAFLNQFKKQEKEADAKYEVEENNFHEMQFSGSIYM